MQAFIARYYQAIFLCVLALLLAAVFYAGFLEGKRIDPQPVTLSCSQNVLDKLSIPVQSLVNGDTPTAVTATTGEYVGSKNGTKYYLPSCAAAQRIKPENEIWFSTAQDAQIQGYTPGSC